MKASNYILPPEAILAAIACAESAPPIRPETAALIRMMLVTPE
jgi:hypothetical protein